MKKLPIIHLGLGKVGKKLMELVQDSKINLKYVAIFNSKGGYYNTKGIGLKDLGKINQSITAEKVLAKIKKPFILIDTTASDSTLPLIEKALKMGGYAVLSNKKPLSSNQKYFDNLHALDNKSFFYETTVGAALPVISSLKNLIQTGDQVLEIEGCFSGTLGFISSSLEKGMTYSQAIKTAMELGFTEPDPRDDLSGLDVARKALILARIMGIKLELKDIERIPFYDEKVKDFALSDKKYGKMFTNASKNNSTYRYTASINKSKVKVGLQKIPKSSPIGNLDGPDNIIVFKTRRYFDNPLVIQGPGAGVEITASGVLADILQILNQIQ